MWAIQSNLESTSVFGTLLISNRKLVPFGLTNNFVASFIARLEHSIFCVTSSAVPVSAKTGVPKLETNITN